MRDGFDEYWKDINNDGVQNSQNMYFYFSIECLHPFFSATVRDTALDRSVVWLSEHLHVTVSEGSTRSLTLARPGGASEARRGIFDLEFSSSRRCSGLEFHDFS